MAILRKPLRNKFESHVHNHVEVGKGIDTYPTSAVDMEFVIIM